MLRIVTKTSYIIGTTLWVWLLLHWFTRTTFLTIPRILIPKPTPTYEHPDHKHIAQRNTLWTANLIL